MSLDLKNVDWLKQEQAADHLIESWINQHIESKPPFQAKESRQKSTFQPVCEEATQTGNFGVVKMVKTELSSQIFAMKEISFVNFGKAENGYNSNKQFEEFRRLRRELKILQLANHQNIVEWYTSFISDKTVCVIMEYVDGGTLRQALNNAGRCPVPIVENILHEVLAGLFYLQDKLNAPHRDIKPSNILVSLTGEIKICDFGMSKINENLSSGALKSVFSGSTLIYITPELVNKNENELDYFKSDIFAFGINILEFCYGIYPIPRLSDAQVIAHLNEHQPLTKPEKQPDVSIVGFIELIGCFETNPPQMLLNVKYFPEALSNLINSMIQINFESRPSYKDIVNSSYYISIGKSRSRKRVSDWINNVKILEK